MHDPLRLPLAAGEIRLEGRANHLATRGHAAPWLRGPSKNSVEGFCPPPCRTAHAPGHPAVLAPELRVRCSAIGTLARNFVPSISLPRPPRVASRPTTHTNLPDRVRNFAKLVSDPTRLDGGRVRRGATDAATTTTTAVTLFSRVTA